MLAVCCDDRNDSHQNLQEVPLNEQKVIPRTSENGEWYLDTRVSNHMTECKEAFASMDESIQGSVIFGDDSRVQIRGKGVVMF